MWAEEANFDGVGSELPVWDVGCSVATARLGLAPAQLHVATHNSGSAS